jgi:arylsulfatase A-like enzyme
LLLARLDWSFAEPMNTALIIGDDFGWADVGANNAGCFYEAPNLHRFAARGSQVTRG